MSAEYRAWAAMKQRCFNPNNRGWKYYGGRGISVHPSWVESFDEFLSEVGRKPTPKHSLDRFPNNDGNYEPGNVRWATAIQQRANQRPRQKKYKVPTWPPPPVEYVPDQERIITDEEWKGIFAKAKRERRLNVSIPGLSRKIKMSTIQRLMGVTWDGKKRESIVSREGAN